ncbi:MAG: tetratricopeptide repeat protein, partial [Syntrophobacteraceae bacterium]
MNKYRYLVLLILSMGVTCGFNWGFSPTDSCTKAKVLAQALAGLSGEKQTKQEERILKLCPDGAAGHFVLGLRHERQGESDEAIGEYRAAIENDETLAEAHGNLGLLLLDKGAGDEAAVELTRGLMGKADPRYHRGLAELLLEGKIYGLARYHFREALKAIPQDVSIHAGLADVYYNLNRLAEAEDEFKTVLAADPPRVSAHLGLAD